MAAGLNPSQHEAVHTLSGPLLVLAGAGTGKTRVVTYRIAKLIQSGVRPSRILAVTFTNKAAGEMQERASALLGKKLPEKPEISTFHSLCVRILRRHIKRLGYPMQFGICDSGDQESYARAALRDIRVPTAVMRPRDLIAQISRWKMASIRPDQAAMLAETDSEHLAAMAYRRYQSALKAAGSVDFDDLLLCTEELLEQFPDVRSDEAARFSHLLIDEYQDTNGSQYRIIRALALPHRNLCVVGDDDQSIYGWRGAEVTHILGFQRDWPDAKVVRLEDNYRSTQPILDMANRLIAHNKVRHPKVLRAAIKDGEPPRVLELPDETQEAERVVDEIRQRIYHKLSEPKDFAILFRTNEQPRAFEAELRRQQIPYTLVGGMSFYDRKEVRDLMAYMKVLVRPQDEVSLLRIINTPPRGIGEKAVQVLLEYAVREGKPLWEVLPAAEQVPGLPSTAVEPLRAFHTLLLDFQQRLEKEAASDVVAQLIADIDYRQELSRNYREPAEQEARWNVVEEVVNSLAEYESRSKRASLAQFVDDLALGDRDDTRDNEKKLQRNTVMLMTLHSAKGLEFPNVYMVGMEEGLLPHARSVELDGPAIDEERRLCYVGVTRAQMRLTLTRAQTRRKWGKPRPTIPSRFLYELLDKTDHPQHQQAIADSRRMIRAANQGPTPRKKAVKKRVRKP